MAPFALMQMAGSEAAPRPIGPSTPPTYDSAEPVGDLSALLPQKPCGTEAGVGDAIVVCGTRHSPYRLRPIRGAQFEKASGAAALDVDGATVAIESEQRNLGYGVTAPAIMVRTKIKF